MMQMQTVRRHFRGNSSGNFDDVNDSKEWFLLNLMSKETKMDYGPWEGFLLQRWTKSGQNLTQKNSVG